jgi:hypothetical protein
MIRIDRGKEVSPGIWEYTVVSLGISSRSRQPLLDACRQIKAMGGSTKEIAGVFNEGSDLPDISCPVNAGAQVTVSEPSKGRVGFAPFQEFVRFA